MLSVCSGMMPGRFDLRPGTPSLLLLLLLHERPVHSAAGTYAGSETNGQDFIVCVACFIKYQKSWEDASERSRLKGDLVFQPPADRAASRGRGQAEQIAHLVFQLAVGREIRRADQHRADIVLLLRGGSGMSEIVDRAVKLDTRAKSADASGSAIARRTGSRSSFVELWPTSRDRNRLSVCSVSRPRTSFSSFWMIGPNVTPLGSPRRVDCEYSKKKPRLKKYSPGSVSWKVFSSVTASHGQMLAATGRQFAFQLDFPPGQHAVADRIGVALRTVAAMSPWCRR